MPAFKHDDRRLLWPFAEKMVRETVHAGVALVRQGDEAKKLYVIASGEASVLLHSTAFSAKASTMSAATSAASSGRHVDKTVVARAISTEEGFGSGGDGGSGGSASDDRRADDCVKADDKERVKQRLTMMRASTRVMSLETIANETPQNELLTFLKRVDIFSSLTAAQLKSAIAAMVEVRATKANQGARSAFAPPCTSALSSLRVVHVAYIHMYVWIVRCMCTDHSEWYVGELRGWRGRRQRRRVR